MSGTADLERLLAVGDLDTTITQLQHRRVALAEKSGLTAIEAELAALVAREKTAMARRSELVARQKELEEQLAALNERRAVVEARMYAATGSSTRDLQAMSDEVRHLSERAGDLETVELTMMVEQDPIDAELDALAEARTPLETRAAELRVTVAGEADAIEAELAQATTSRATEAAALPAALADRYQYLSTRLKGVGVARLIGHRCDGCHLELSSVEVERVRHQGPDEVATCEQCGRILVAA